MDLYYLLLEIEFSKIICIHLQYNPMAQEADSSGFEPTLSTAVQTLNTSTRNLHKFNIIIIAGVIYLMQNILICPGGC